ncbi:unnamed protein product, partial [Iphiclides podalirius]
MCPNWSEKLRFFLVASEAAAALVFARRGFLSSRIRAQWARITEVGRVQLSPRTRRRLEVGVVRYSRTAEATDVRTS